MSDGGGGFASFRVRPQIRAFSRFFSRAKYAYYDPVENFVRDHAYRT